MKKKGERAVKEGIAPVALCPALAVFHHIIIKFLIKNNVPRV